ncbi:hypothetical protein ACR9E3_16665 [Actinomycetospora sp. C-140]
MSIVGWVLVGLGGWLVVSVAVAFVVARLAGPDVPIVVRSVPAEGDDTGDGPRESFRVPGNTSRGADPDVPAPRDDAHDGAEAADQRPDGFG